MAHPIEVTDAGLYCEAGDFYIDPVRPVDKAVVTHAHADHARWGSRSYLCSQEAEGVMRVRLAEASIQAVPYGEPVTLGNAKVSLHPAGHILGSSQVRVEVDGSVAVVTGDYKLEPDKTCTPYEPVQGDLFVTETTFGLPIYRWEPEEQVFDEINAWWRQNQKEGRASVVCGYALGKAQRLLSGVDRTIGEIVVHGALPKLTDCYRAQGVDLPDTKSVSELPKGFDYSQALVVAPPSALGTPWMRRFNPYSTAFASGWMAVRGSRRRRAVDRGFVLSDHVDWPSLLTAVELSEASEVWTTHGYTDVVSRHLAEQGYRTRSLGGIRVETTEEDAEFSEVGG
jgi:putative mRNA 3-end processing factor